MEETPWELICFVSIALVVFFFKCFYYIMRCREKEQQARWKYCHLIENTVEFLSIQVAPGTQAADIKQDLREKGSDKAEG